VWLAALVSATLLGVMDFAFLRPGDPAP
jgi:hypothetical protein